MSCLRKLALLVAVLACVACAGMGVGEQPSAAADPEAMQTASSSSERFQQVLRLLEQGNSSAARAELIIYLQQQPDSQIGGDLLRQIDLPASDYFPSEHRVVKLEAGESLSTLSEKYLGDVYQFYALAKYNGIARPARLEQNQAIKVPLTEHARKQFDIQTATAAPAEQPGPEDLPPNQDRADELHLKALNEFRAQNLDSAISLWDQVLSIDPDYEKARLYRSQAVDLKEKLTQIK